MSKLLRMVGALVLIYPGLFSLYHFIMNIPIYALGANEIQALLAAFAPIVFSGVLSLICFGVARQLERQQRIEDYLAALQKRAAARRAPPSARMPLDDKVTYRIPTPYDVERARAPRRPKQTILNTLPGRDSPLRDIPLSNERQNRELPGRGGG